MAQTNIFYLNGKFVPENKACISVYDLGFLRSYGVFEFLRTYHRKPFYLREHLKRLLKSARLINLKHPYSLSFLEKIVYRTLAKNKHLNEANIRIILTGGVSKDSLTPSKPTLIVMITPLKTLPPSLYEKGAKIILQVFKRPNPQAKHLDYAKGVEYLEKAKKKGAVEVLFVDRQGKIYECATSNFFAVIKGKIFTPKNEDVLEGITRKIVFKLASKLKIPIEERDLFIKEIPKFDEAFITSTNKEILPIVKIDSFLIGNGKPGEITKLLMSEFHKHTSNF